MTSPLSPEAVAQMVDDIIADRAIGMPDHGGWAWFGGRDHVYLATRSGGRHYVMDFVRKGMKSAQPRFQIKGCMHGAVDELTTYQVGDGIARGQDQAVTDPSVYRLDVSGIDHPDARRMQRIPDMERAVLTLATENATLREERDDAFARGMAHGQKAMPKGTFNVVDSPELATLRASEAAALEALVDIGVAVAALEGADSLDKEIIRNIGTLIAALTPTADKE